MGKLRKRPSNFMDYFVEGKYQEDADASPPPPEPVHEIAHADLKDEWEQYQQERQAHDETHPIKVRNRQLAYIRALNKEQSKRAYTELLKRDIVLARFARSYLRVELYDKLDAVHEEYKQMPKVSCARPTFSTWLQRQGLHQEAEKWRHREALRRRNEQEREQEREQKSVTPPTTPKSTEVQAFEKYAHAVNADRYRVTCLKMDEHGGKKAFILDKKDGESKGFTAAEMVQRMPTMQRLQARRENIYYTPLSDDKHHILIDDMTVESVTRLKKDGFVPAVILESSPKNYQSILTIPKVDSPFTREASNRLTEWLNKEYGDPKLSGCIHPHRAPAFGNIKPKHRNPDGSYPRVKLLAAERKQCDKAFLRAREIAKQYEEQERQKKSPRQTHPAPPPANTPHGDSGHSPSKSGTSSYYAHYDDIRKHMNIQDYSRLDAMIALRMRATGHSPQSVMDAVQHCAPNIRTKEGRDWQKYAERTANYAFGVAGDVALRKYERYVEQWKASEGFNCTTQIIQKRRLM